MIGRTNSTATWVAKPTTTSATPATGTTNPSSAMEKPRSPLQYKRAGPNPSATIQAPQPTPVPAIEKSDPTQSPSSNPANTGPGSPTYSRGARHASTLEKSPPGRE